MSQPLSPALGEYRADLEVDFANEDERGLLWTWLDRARDESVVAPDAVLVLRDGEDLALGQVVELDRLEQGTVVRVRLLPGAVEEYHAAVERAVSRPA
jgi:hypothetical protein